MCKAECESVFLFVAELSGSFEPGSGDEAAKIACGRSDYVGNKLLDLDLSDEDDLKDLHENIWLKRLYKELDVYFGIEDGNAMVRYLKLETEAYRDAEYQWQVPLECDASASLLQYVGILLNDSRLMEMTNVIGETLQDPWKLKGMPRKMLKSASTPMLYGSSKSCEDLWNAAGFKATKTQSKIYRKEMASGPFGLANLFKDFIIQSCKPAPRMKIKIGDDVFTIDCNRFRNVGEETKAYKIWDSNDCKYKVLLHTDTKKVPDLERFVRYFVTLLIHNLDGQVADEVSAKTFEKYGWVIPIHDAFLIPVGAAQDVRNWYAEAMERIHVNRKQILSDYFKSIGIGNEAVERWKKVKDKVVPFEGVLKVNRMALK